MDAVTLFFLVAIPVLGAGTLAAVFFSLLREQRNGPWNKPGEG
jgi:hypothetical protein